MGTLRDSFSPSLVQIEIHETPLFIAAGGPEAYTALFARVIPHFAERVSFVLAEVLELDRTASRARLFLYSHYSSEMAEQVVTDYFKVIDKLFAGRKWSISSLDNFYFDPVIWCGRIPGNEHRRSARSGPPRWWHSERNLRRDYNLGASADVTSIEEAFAEYLDGLLSLDCFQGEDDSYVLLIPVALNSPTSSEELQRFKLGAVFLHFRTSCIVEPSQLLSIYREIVEYWHYWFTSEALARRVRDLVVTQGMAESGKLMERIKTDLQTILGIANSLRVPAARIINELRPIDLVTATEGALRPLFTNRGRVELNERVFVFGAHKWVEGGDLLRYQRICAATVLSLLGLESNAREPLWEQVFDELIVSPRPEYQRTMGILVRYCPELLERVPTPAQLRRLFLRFKQWFHSSFKDSSDGEGDLGLAVDLLAFYLELGGIPVAGDLPSGAVAVLSSTPMKTCVAIQQIAGILECGSAEFVALTDRARLTLSRRGDDIAHEDLVRMGRLAVGPESDRGDMADAVAMLFGGRKGEARESDGVRGLYCSDGGRREIAMVVPGTNTICFDLGGYIAADERHL